MVCVDERRKVSAFVITIPDVCGRSSLEDDGGRARASAAECEGIPLMRHECCARYRFPLKIGTRRRSPLGRLRFAETFRPDWRRNSGKALYPPARECEDVLTSSQIRLSSCRFGEWDATFTISVHLLAIGR